MTASIEDVLQVNMVLVGIGVINTQSELASFYEDVGVEVTSVEAGVVGADTINRTHTLNRDRININATQDRSVVSREYPEEHDLRRLAQVAGMAISSTDLEGQELRAFGYNIELVFEPISKEQAIHYLLKRLFNPDLFRSDGSRLLGGTGRIFFEKGGRNWRATLQPRFNDENTSKIFLSLNLHRPETDPSLLTEIEIRDSLNALWAEAQNLVNQLEAYKR